MAKVIAKNADVLAGGRRVSHRSNSVTLSMTAEAPEATGFANYDTRQRLADGVKDVELSVAGVQDITACQVDVLYGGLLAGSAYWGFYPEGATTSNMGYEFVGIVTDYTAENALEGAATTAVTVSGVAGGSTGAPCPLSIVRGTSLAYTTIAEAGTSALCSVDFSGSTASPWGIFRILTLTGTNPEVSACWHESGDDATFTMAACFTTSSAADVVRTASLSAGASRYQRVRITLAGTSPCSMFTMISGSLL